MIGAVIVLILGSSLILILLHIFCGLFKSTSNRSNSEALLFTDQETGSMRTGNSGYMGSILSKEDIMPDKQYISTVDSIGFKASESDDLDQSVFSEVPISNEINDDDRQSSFPIDNMLLEVSTNEPDSAVEDQNSKRKSKTFMKRN